MFCFRARRRLIPYSEGALGPKAARAVAEHVAKCQRCAGELAIIGRTGSLLRGAGAPAQEPAADLWQRIEMEITGPVPARSAWRARGLQAAGAAAAVAIIWLGMANMGGVRKPAADDQVRKAVPHSVVRTPATPSVPTKIAAVPKAAAPKLVYHKAPSAPRHRRMVIANADTEGSTHVYNGTPGPRREETTSISEPPMVIALNPEFADPFSVRKSSNPVGPAFSGPGTAEDGKPSPSLASGGTNMDATGASATDGALDACEDVGARYKADSGAETDVTITNVDLLNDADADTRVAALFSYP